MDRFLNTLRRLHDEEDGHAAPGLTTLVAGAGGVVLGIGAASDSDIVTIIGGVVLGLGILAAGVIRHRDIDYDIYRRLEQLEKK